MERKMKSLLLYLDSEIYDCIREMAREERTNMSFVIGELLKRALANQCRENHQKNS